MKWLIPYQGQTWTFDDDRITSSEARIQKRITGGLLPAQADAARAQMDPDAWESALAIARLRSGMDREKALAIDSDDLELTACMTATREAGEAELRAARQADDDTPSVEAEPPAAEAPNT